MNSALGPLVVDLDGDVALTRRDRQRLQHPLVGGVILFKRNYEDRPQLRELTSEIKSLRDPKLLITVDQEGGRVQRFRGRFKRLPPAAVVGRLYDEDPRAGRRLAYNTGLVMASELLAVGVDLSFAPVLDVLSRDSLVIGDRAFHSDPEAVHHLAGAYIDGMHAAGMGSVGKHFPGHGGVSDDSHVCLPDDSRGMAELRDTDLRPFESLAGRLQGVMLAHVIYSAINARIPSYSAFWVKDVLREEIGFQGAVFSDDLSMAGAGDEPLIDRCRAALAAGCDLLPVCKDRRAVDRVLRAPEDEWPTGDTTERVAALYARPETVDEGILTAAGDEVEQAALNAA